MKQIITCIRDLREFQSILETNPGLVIIKFGAKWCGPCKKIEDVVDTWFKNSPSTVQCCLIDIDECIDIYGYLKTKKMIRGVPGILCWKKGNLSYIPDEIINEGDPVKVNEFFRACVDML